MLVNGRIGPLSPSPAFLPPKSKSSLTGKDFSSLFYYLNFNVTVIVWDASTHRLNKFREQ